MIKTVRGVEAMYEEARQFIESLKAQNKATTVTLSGDLGSGKTTFVQGIAQALKVKGAITSPTFVIMKTYPIEYSGFHTLIHIDAYRLNDPHEMEALGWADLIKDPSNLVCIEWPERIEKIIKNTDAKITLTFVDENTRTVDFS